MSSVSAAELIQRREREFGVFAVAGAAECGNQITFLVGDAHLATCQPFVAEHLASFGIEVSPAFGLKEVDVGCD